MMDKETELRIKYCGMKQSKLAKAAIQLEKEADWLAKKLANIYADGYKSSIPYPKAQHEYWREAARKATQGE